jgi:branched-chain amino acid transport system substrate-binding protein
VPVNELTRVFVAAVLATLGGAVAGSVAQAQPIRIGATLGQTGGFAALGQDQLRGYQLCVKHLSEKGGVLGRKLELLVYDDGSDPGTAVRLYDKLITQDKVDLVLARQSGPITDAVANVTEKHKLPMVAPSAADTAIYSKGRKFIFSMQPSAGLFLEGLIDLAAKKGLKTVALINVNDIFGRSVMQGTSELAGKKGLQVVFADAYPEGNTDFSAILRRVRAANPDVLGGATRFEDGVAITRQIKALNLNPKMTGLTGVDLTKFYEVVGRDAEFVYGRTPWLPELLEVRAGGLIPIARQYPGAREFVESYSLRPIPGRSQWGPDRSQDVAVPVAGRQEGHRLARGAGPGQATFPYAALEPALRRARPPGVHLDLPWSKRS